MTTMTHHQTDSITTLESLLCNTSTERFHEFAAFLQRTFCAENLVFWLSVKQYDEHYQQRMPGMLARGLRPMHSEPNLLSGAPEQQQTAKLQDLPTHERSSLPAPEQTSDCHHLEQECLAIVERHIWPNSPQEINIPCEMRQEILQHIKNGMYHPAIFSAATEAVLDLMQVNSFIPWINTPQMPTASTSPSLSSSSPHECTKEHTSKPARPSFASFRSANVRNTHSAFSSPSLKVSVLLRVKRSLGIMPRQVHLSTPNPAPSIGENIRNWSPWRKIQR